MRTFVVIACEEDDRGVDDVGAARGAQKNACASSEIFVEWLDLEAWQQAGERA